jgi:hypothetical protein
MFGRSKSVATPPAGTGRQLSRYAPDPGVVCLPYYPSAVRLDAITQQAARGLQGHAGLVYGYDRGDPTLSLTGPVKGIQSPTDAQARVYANPAASAKPPMTYQDTPGTDPSLDPYKSLAWSRMVAQ